MALFFRHTKNTVTIYIFIFFINDGQVVKSPKTKKNSSCPTEDNINLK